MDATNNVDDDAGVKLLAIVLVACGPAPAPAPPKLAGAVASVCPLAIFPDQAWAHEVFAGCPEMPFTLERLPVCAGTCPHACRAITGARVFTIHYDGQGRWTDMGLESSTDAADLLSIRCAYDGDQMTSCTRKYLGNIEWTDRFERDAHGKLARIVNDEESIDIERDPAGRPTGLITKRSGGEVHVRLAYDDRGRITREQTGDHVVSYDYDGDRLRERRDDVLDTTFGYDGNRLASVVTRGHTGSKSETRVAYDGEAIRSVTRDGETTTYQYDCR